MTVLADGCRDVVSAFVLSAYFQIKEKHCDTMLGGSHTGGMGRIKSSCCRYQLVSSNTSDGAKVQNSLKQNLGQVFVPSASTS